MTTAQRGYGADHKHERARWAPVVARGEAYCAEIICLMPDRWIEPGTAWDLAHDRATGGYFGPAHALCNRSEGGHYGSLGRGRPRNRTCVICGEHYHAGYTEQRACSRRCGVELKRRNSPPPKPKPVPQQRTRTHGTAYSYQRGCRCQACWDWYCGTYQAKNRQGPRLKAQPSRMSGSRFLVGCAVTPPAATLFYTQGGGVPDGEGNVDVPEHHYDRAEAAGPHGNPGGPISARSGSRDRLRAVSDGVAVDGGAARADAGGVAGPRGEGE